MIGINSILDEIVNADIGTIPKQALFKSAVKFWQYDQIKQGKDPVLEYDGRKYAPTQDEILSVKVDEISIEKIESKVDQIVTEETQPVTPKTEETKTVKTKKIKEKKLTLSEIGLDINDLKIDDI